MKGYLVVDPTPPSTNDSQTGYNQRAGLFQAMKIVKFLATFKAK